MLQILEHGFVWLPLSRWCFSRKIVNKSRGKANSEFVSANSGYDSNQTFGTQTSVPAIVVRVHNVSFW